MEEHCEFGFGVPDKKACRLCLSSCDKNIDIFGTLGTRKNLQQIIKKCLSIMVVEQEQKPTWICTQCLSHLDSLLSFWIRAHKTDQELSSLYGSSDFVTEVPSIDIPFFSGICTHDKGVQTMDDNSLRILNGVKPKPAIRVTPGKRKSVTFEDMTFNAVNSSTGMPEFDVPEIAIQRQRQDIRLIPFIVRSLEARAYPGLVWQDRDQGIFKLPWPRQGTKHWTPEDSLLFKEWAVLKGRFREGQDEFINWKTCVRVSLQKLTNVRELSEQHYLRRTGSYKVYQILNIQEYLSKPLQDHDYEVHQKLVTMSPLSPAQVEYQNGVEDEEMIFACGACNMGFAALADVEKHVRTHMVEGDSQEVRIQDEDGNEYHEVEFELDENETPVIHSSQNDEGTRSVVTEGAEHFYCSSCDAIFKDLMSLNEHLQDAHCKEEMAELAMEEDDFPVCQYCDERLNSVEDLRDHIAVIHGLEMSPFICGDCWKGFDSSDELHDHVTQEHSATYVEIIETPVENSVGLDE